MLEFMIPSVMSSLIVGLGIFCFYAKKAQPFGVWSSTKMFKVKDVKSYNRALGKLWIVLGITLELFAMLMLMGDNPLFIVIATVGMLISAIVAMGIYVLIIEPKYRIK